MGQKQGLDNVLEAADLLQGHDTKIILAGDGNDRTRLFDRAKHLKLRNVSFLGLQPASGFDAMLRAADVLLVNQRAMVGDMALPSKLTSYLVSGRPIVAAVEPESNAALELRAAGAGIIVRPGQPAALAGAIRELQTSPGFAEHLGAQGAAYAQRYLTRQTALPAFDDFLKELTNGGTISARCHSPGASA
jgi:glycosyltransferase involved in cell wall biosynthesis